MNSATMSEPLPEHVRLAENIEAMQDLLGEILSLQKDSSDIQKGVKKVQEIVLKSNDYVENSISTNEIILDAKILHAGSTVVNLNVSNLNTNLTAFNESKYILGIQKYMKESNHVVEIGKEWECLAPIAFKLFKRSNPPTFLAGALDMESLEPIANKRGRKKRAPEPEKTSVTVVEAGQDEGATLQRDIYQHILKYLLKYYKKRHNKPVNYFKLVIDPTDYWRTIENIFHFSFLVRDGTVKMSSVEGLPYIEPVMRKPEEDDNDDDDDDDNVNDDSQPKVPSHQFCFSLDMKNWQKLIKRFHIRKIRIPPYDPESSD